MTQEKKIAVMTSGGDAPGMNACVRSVVRTAMDEGVSIFGIYSGYTGLLEGDLMPLNRRSVSNIIQKGGTFLKTSRCETFRHESGRKRGADVLREWGIDSLIVIGGDGSFHGAHALAEEQGIQVIGIPATIDNDIYGTDLTIGYDTAVKTALDSIDKIRDTAASHDRLFIVEVMGRDAGFIALEVGICGGAEEILVPEIPSNLDELGKQVELWRKAGKNSSLIIVAEGDDLGDAQSIAHQLDKNYHIKSHVCVLGHTQRGGTPTATDRLLATQLGYYAVKGILEEKSDVMIGMINNKKAYTPLKESWENKKDLDPELLKIYRIMSS